MSTLLLRLAAPLQSWGATSKFDTRDTAREPTKSGVIGLLAAALGRSRSGALDDLQGLRFGVRIDQPGILLRDYHTAKREKGKNAFATTRYYLSDAVFIAGLEGEKGFLQTLVDALLNPVYPLYLGRRSCPPEGELVLGVRDLLLLEALEKEPWQARPWYINRHAKQSEKVRLSIVKDAKPVEIGAFLRRDLPISFNQRHRQYDFRMVMDTVAAVSISLPQIAGGTPTEHDAMAGWGD